jgi:L-lactate dehydrogenase complex protein LldG
MDASGNGAKDGGAREDILSRVRRKLGVRGDEISRRSLVNERLSHPAASIIPERVRKPRAELVRLFQSMLEASGAKVVRTRSKKQLPEAVASVLRERNLPLRVRCGDDPLFKTLAEGDAPLLEVLRGPARPDDLASLSHASAAAAETGTLFLLSGASNPSTLNFLPETHIVAIEADDIQGPYEDCWAKLRASRGPGQMPRTVNLISGASRTADIEQTIVMGAHGPKYLAVIIIGTIRNNAR